MQFERVKAGLTGGTPFVDQVAETGVLTPREVSRSRVTLAGMRRVIDTIGWGRRPRDRVLIATYYGLLAGSRVFRGRHGIGVGMLHEPLVGSVCFQTPS